MPLSEPPRDKHGAAVPHDHSEIIGSDRIIRRITEEHIVPDTKAKSGRRISKLAFQASTEGNRSMSVDIEKLIAEALLDPQEKVTVSPFIGAVWFFTEFLRSETFQVGFDPILENPYHGGVWGNFTDSKRKRMLKNAAWYVQIDDVDLHVG